MTEEALNRFRLYIMNSSPAGKRAIANFQRISAELYGNQAKLEVVDILENPAMAENDRIIAVPALIRLSPSPVIKIIGDLTDTPSLRASMGV
jgi:circadian clock protein KaiB